MTEREDLFARSAALSDYFLDAVFDLQDIGVVSDIRGCGLLAAFDVKPGAVPGARGTELQKKLFWNGVHIKFTGDSGLIAPPFIIEREEIDAFCAILRRLLEEEDV